MVFRDPYHFNIEQRVERECWNSNGKTAESEEVSRYYGKETRVLNVRTKTSEKRFDILRNKR